MDLLALKNGKTIMIQSEDGEIHFVACTTNVGASTDQKYFVTEEARKIAKEQSHKPLLLRRG